MYINSQEDDSVVKIRKVKKSLFCNQQKFNRFMRVSGDGRFILVDVVVDAK